MANKITVTSVGTTANVNATPDIARYYSDKSKEWAIGDKLIDNEDYSSKYYANESKKQADISIAKTTEVVESGNTAVSNIESARDNALSAIGQTNGSGARGEAITAITNNKTSALTEISSKQNTAVSAISTQQTNAIKAVQNQQTSSVNTVKSTGQSYVDKCKAWASSPNVVEGGLYSAKYYAEMAQGKSDVTYETLRASRAYEDKGALLTDEQGFAEVAKYKHSTFDLSKFTVVGSPTITEDGVASGLAYSTAFIKTTYIVPASTANSWSVEIRNFYVSSLSSGQRLFSFDANNTFIYISQDGKIKTFISGSKTGDIANDVYVNYTTSIGETLNIKFCFTGIAYEVWINGNKTYSKETTTKISVNQLMTVYSGGSGYAPCIGEHDLKNFFITVDGKEVFNGNKTGLDVIKPDNYTVIGSPVISDDGVLSNCTFNADYVSSKQTFNLYNANTWEIQCHYNPMGLSNEPEYFMFYSPTINSNGLHLGYRTKSTLQLTVFEDGNKIVLTNPNIPLNWESYTDYLFKVRFTGTQYLLDYSKDNGNTWIKLLTVNSNKKTVSSPVYVRNGIYSSSGIDYGIKIGITDLNKTKVYIDGNLVYQPCLKIPYTQSKTGSKIVDVAYRDRVIDLYEQEGQAGYYTIDEPNKNFTLPMGEIYGMIGQRSLISSTVTETNRVDIYSDKTCLICGNVSTAGTINLPIELVNNNYFITLSTSTKTATSFTTTSTGDYILIGKVA